MFFDELSNDEWALVSALVSEGDVREHRRGRPRAHPRTIVNAVLWILSTGETWSKLPSHYPTVPTCRRRFNDWQMSGVLIEIVTRLASRGRSFAITPSTPVAAPERAVQQNAYECDRLRGVFWQNPESWNVPYARDAIEGSPAVPRRLAESRDVARANAPIGGASNYPSARSALRPHEAQPMSFDSFTSPIHDGRGFSIYAIARPVANGMFRGWAEIIKDGRRVERSGLIGPRYGSADEATAYALDWSNKWIAAQTTRLAPPAAAIAPVSSGPIEAPLVATAMVRIPNDVPPAGFDSMPPERAEYRYADMQG